MITEDQVTEALKQNAVKMGDEWAFSSPLHRHSEPVARRIVEACLMLEQPVTDIVTAQAWLAMVFRIVDLQERIEVLEHE